MFNTVYSFDTITNAIRDRRMIRLCNLVGVPTGIRWEGGKDIYLVKFQDGTEVCLKAK